MTMEVETEIVTDGTDDTKEEDVSPMSSPGGRIVSANDELVKLLVLHTVAMAVLPSSFVSISIPIIENGRMSGLLLNMTWLNWMIQCLVTSNPLFEITVERLQCVLQTKRSLRTWATPSMCDVNVIIRRRHYEFLAKKVGSREFTTLNRRLAFRKCKTTKEIAELDYSLQEIPKDATEWDFHPLIVSAYRRYACRTCPQEDGSSMVVPWYDIPCKLRVPEVGAVKSMISTILEERGKSPTQQDLALMEVRDEMFDGFMHYFQPVRI